MNSLILNSKNSELSKTFHQWIPENLKKAQRMGANILKFPLGEQFQTNLLAYSSRGDKVPEVKIIFLAPSRNRPRTDLEGSKHFSKCPINHLFMSTKKL